MRGDTIAMKTTFKQFALQSLSFVLGIFLFLSTSCNQSTTVVGKDSAQNVSANETSDTSTILTDIFSSTDVLLPENYGIHTKVTPYYNSETETITAFASSWEEVETDTKL